MIGDIAANSMLAITSRSAHLRHRVGLLGTSRVTDACQATRRGCPRRRGPVNSSSRVQSFGRLLMSAPLEPGDLPVRDRAQSTMPPTVMLLTGVAEQRFFHFASCCS
jgi:hypothetical protein